MKKTQKQKEDEAKKKTLEQCYQDLSTGPDGLSSEEAGRRQEKYGPNLIEEKKENPLLKFLSYFWGPIPWMIEAAALLSAAVRHWADLFIIIFLLVFNAVVGFWEEHEVSN